MNTRNGWETIISEGRNTPFDGRVMRPDNDARIETPLCINTYMISTVCINHTEHSIQLSLYNTYIHTHTHGPNRVHSIVYRICYALYTHTFGHVAHIRPLILTPPISLKQNTRESMTGPSGRKWLRLTRISHTHSFDCVNGSLLCLVSFVWCHICQRLHISRSQRLVNVQKKKQWHANDVCKWARVYVFMCVCACIAYSAWEAKYFTSHIFSGEHIKFARPLQKDARSLTHPFIQGPRWCENVNISNDFTTAKITGCTVGGVNTFLRQVSFDINIDAWTNRMCASCGGCATYLYVCVCDDEKIRDFTFLSCIWA